MRLVGLMRRMEALGDGGAGGREFALDAPWEEEEEAEGPRMLRARGSEEGEEGLGIVWWCE